MKHPQLSFIPRLPFIKDRSGATIIEFAIVAPMLFLLLAGIIEIGLILFTFAAMEGATNIGSRTGKTGFSQGSASRESFIRNEIQRLTGGFLDPSKLSISVLSYSSYSNIGKPEPCLQPLEPPCPGTSGVNYVDINGNGQWDADQGRSTAGGSGSIVLYRVHYPWTMFTPIMASLIGTGGQYDITATAAVRNEQFQ